MFWIQYNYILSKHIGVLLFLMMQGVNMMSVVLYNTAHESELGPITQNHFNYNYNYFEISTSITITITPS